MLTEYFKWWIADEPIGGHRLTAFKLNRADAARAFPGAKPDPQTLELRDVQNPRTTRPDSRPGGDWS